MAASNEVSGVLFSPEGFESLEGREISRDCVAAVRPLGERGLFVYEWHGRVPRQGCCRVWYGVGGTVQKQ